MTDTTAGPDVPELVPARMLNEFCYCPRLFFIEWVEARFADNADTVEGRWAHKAVDVEGGRAPLPEDDEPFIVTRSLPLSSTEYGITLRCDIVEAGDDGSVVPVDHKKGVAPDIPEGAWEPERVQLCAQGLLLQEAGYDCDHGFIYFRTSRRRVRVDFDDTLVALTLDRLAALREVAASGLPPPPLVDSPKCPRCSLNGLCLPDETNLLAERTDRPARQLMPSGDDAKPLHVIEQGAWVGKKKGRITVSKDKEEIASVRLLDVSQLCIHGNVQVSTQLLRELMAEDVPVCFFSYGGWFSGMAHGLPTKHVDLRRRQVSIAAQGGLAVARRVVEGKIRNCRTLLMRNARDKPGATVTSLKRLAADAAEAPTVETLLGIEGAAARLYFGAFTNMLKPDPRLPGLVFDFSHRNRRPPKDAINCLLSYGYSMLTKELTVATFIVGFDPYIGFYHRPRYGRPALALDLAEEFRPLIVDSTVLTLVNNGELNGRDFVVRAGGVSLTPSGRKTVTRAFERRLDAEVTHPRFGYRITYRRVLEVQARLLGAHLMGEIPDYPPFVTR
jgi:CRISPR-associated protein Cas1